MTAFSAEAYKQMLKMSTDIDDCEKVPVPKLKDGQNYIFISYSHKDFRQVYCDLADLYENGIPFWYDEGLPAGINWDDVVREKLNDPLCRGVIFYLSESLFLSQSIQTEIRIVCGENSGQDLRFRRLDYFCVNLTNMAPSAILSKTFPAKAFTDTDDRMTALVEWSQTLAKAFPDKATYLLFSGRAHKMDLIEQIGVRFNITPVRNPYEFRGAEFLSGTATIRFENGSQYNGSFRNNAFSGEGTMEYSGGAVYSGGWENGKHCHNGRMTYPDGTIYDGEWKDGSADGAGTMTFHNGSVYNGMWKAGKRHGKGIMRSLDGAAYEGDWKNGERHGIGIMTYPDGVIYIGQWKNGERHGDGTITYLDGAVLKGVWRNGELHGAGRVTQSSGTYESDIEKSELDVIDPSDTDIEYKLEGNDDAEWHSEGTKHYLDSEYFDTNWEKTEAFSEGSKSYFDDYPDSAWEKEESLPDKFPAPPTGDTYEGSQKNGEPHGSGTMTYANGNIYKGEWKNGDRHGLGTMTFANGNVYSGQWKNGERHGKGLLTYANGSKYNGEWKNDIAYGQGTYCYPDGASRSGFWDGSELLSGQGVLRYADGSFYDGKIRNNLRHGKGVYTLPDGTVQVGVFEDDVFLGPD